MKFLKRNTEKTKTEISPAERASQAWQKQVELLAHQNHEARKGLVEEVACQRAFQHLDKDIGKGSDAFPEKFEKVAKSYLDGKFFLRHLALFFEVRPELSLLVYNLRQEWIQQYDLRTVPELMLLDQAMVAYFHILRLNRQVADMLALTEVQLFYPESPAVKIQETNKLGREFDGFVAEDAVAKLQERLMPLLEKFNSMFIRNLRLLRELKVSPINIKIGKAEQVNVGQQQINTHKSKKGDCD